MSRPSLRVGLVGAGQVAEHHARAYAQNPEARITAVADVDADRAAALAAPYGAVIFASYEDLLESKEVDAVSVCLPHDLHLPVALAAAEEGVHMLMEKPISNTLEEADQMIRATERAGVTMMVGFVHRFRTEVLEAKRLIDEGAIGAPATALDRFCSLGGPHPPSWVWRKHRAGGGVLMYGGIHAIDRILWLMRTSATRVFARQHNYAGYGDVEDGLLALLELADGTSATLFENSPPYGRPGGWATEIFGEQGAIRIQTGEFAELTTAGRCFTVRSQDERHFEREIDEFVSAVLGERESSVPPAAGRDSLAVALAIYASAATGIPVSLSTDAARADAAV
jgi:phthalate 4,5-cis-dihydrodiol dehydrogenase